MPRVKINDVEINYEVNGTGEPLVLIHGLGGSLKMWVRQIPAFSKHFRTIAYDCRGHGDSEKSKEQYSMKDLADDLKGLLDKLEVEKAHILGLSMGTIIAQVFAINYQSRIKTLILAGVASAPTYYREERTPAIEAIERMFTDAMKPRENFDVNEFMLTLARYAFSEGISEELLNPLAITMGQMIDEEALFTALNAMGTLDFADQLQKINVPTLIINGDQDMLTPLSGARATHRLIPNLELVVIRGGSHCAFIENAEEFNAAVLKFLRKYCR